MLYEIKKQSLPNGEILAYRETQDDIQQNKNGETLACGDTNNNNAIDPAVDTITKPTLILLHGNQSSSLFYEQLMKQFESKAHIFSIDMAGFGESTYNHQHETVREWADDIALFMDELKIPSAIVLGWSAGGGVAMELAACYPEKVQHLILMSSVGVKGFKLPKRDSQMKPVPGIFLFEKNDVATDPTIVMTENAMREQNDKFFRAVWEHTIFDLNPPEDDVFDAFMREIVKERCYVDISIALCQFNITHEADLVEGSGRISEIRCPVTWIHGRQDKIVPFATGADSIPYFECPVDFKAFDNAGHAPYIDQPEMFADILDGIIENV